MNFRKQKFQCACSHNQLKSKILRLLLKLLRFRLIDSQIRLALVVFLRQCHTAAVGKISLLHFIHSFQIEKVYALRVMRVNLQGVV